MQAFVDNGFKGADLKSLNFVQKYIKAISLISLANIDTVDGHCVLRQVFEALSSNGLCGDIR